MNIGHNERLGFDSCAFSDRVRDSTGPLLYRVNPNFIANRNGCLSTGGPIGTHGVSTVIDSSVTNTISPKQMQVDTESLLTNRNVLNSKCRNKNMNLVNPTNFELQNVALCENSLVSQSTRLIEPLTNYRAIPVNRFINLPHMAQSVIYYDVARNTQLEMRDSYDWKTSPNGTRWISDSEATIQNVGITGFNPNSSQNNSQETDLNTSTLGTTVPSNVSNQQTVVPFYV